MIADIDLVGIPPDDGYFLDIAKRKYSVVFKQDSTLARNFFCKHGMGLTGDNILGLMFNFWCYLY